jgi:phage-related protein
VIWLGDSRRNIQEFPAGARKLIGDELQLIQFGGMPKDAKPFKGIGSGVIEIALAYEKDAYLLYWQCSLEKGSTSCTPFRRRPSRASKRLRKISI